MKLDEFRHRYTLQHIPQVAKRTAIEQSIAKNNLRQAAVLIGLIERENELHLLLTQRPAHLRAHPGQISFPGGKVEQQDSSYTATALREAFEEIALPHQNVEILGQYPSFNTFTGFVITPVIGVVKQEFEPKLDPNEVDALFTIPLSYLLNPRHRIIKHFTRYGITYPVYFIPFKQYMIWGATAAIIDTFCRQIGR